MRHTKDQFAGLHVIVFDDVGTKVSVESIPESLREPTYIIESSAGNFQYGYVLDSPITDLEKASALVNVAGKAGLTDEGGKMPVKLVRLPDGINGKVNSDKQTFHVNLVAWNDRYFTPEILVERMNCYDGDTLITWQMIDVDGYNPKPARRASSPMHPGLETFNLDGCVDEVAEWLHKENKVFNDNGDGWMEIECPWGHTHSDGNPTAGYNPLGVGDNPTNRGFNCFHEHCKDKDTEDFLRHVCITGGFDYIPFSVPNIWFDLMAKDKWAFCTPDNGVYRINKEAVPTAFKLEGFKNGVCPQKVFAMTPGGPEKIELLRAWLANPFTLKVDGLTSRPGKPLLVENDTGKYINTFTAPDWGNGPIDQRHVDIFTGYLDYLIPDPDERLYFMDWMSAKMLDPRFRGPAILMCATAFGVGRSTLSLMLIDLLGERNTASVTLDTLAGSAFNFWEDKTLVVLQEARETTPTGKTNPHKIYEALKTHIDTTNVMVTMNLKYEKQRQVESCSSFLILTNHVDAVAVPEGDRRITVITNAEQYASKDYFDGIRAWRDNEEWQPSVFQWLCQRTITSDLTRAMETVGKTDMVDDTMTPISRIVSQFNKYCERENISIVTVAAMREVLDKAVLTMGVTHDYPEAHIRKCFNEVSKAFSVYRVRSKAGTVGKVRAMFWAYHTSKVPGLKPRQIAAAGSALSEETKLAARLDVDRLNIAAAVTAIVDAIG